MDLAEQWLGIPQVRKAFRGDERGLDPIKREFTYADAKPIALVKLQS